VLARQAGRHLSHRFPTGAVWWRHQGRGPRDWRHRLDRNDGGNDPRPTARGCTHPCFFDHRGRAWTDPRPEPWRVWVADARCGIRSALWLASSTGTTDPTHALVYGLSAVLVLAFGSATLLQARGASGAAAAIGATALLATSPALTYLAGTNATTLLLPLVAVIIAMPSARGIRGAAVGVITVAVAVLDLALSPFALLPVAGQDPA
jgi:hypothetical protein